MMLSPISTNNIETLVIEFWRISIEMRVLSLAFLKLIQICQFFNILKKILSLYGLVSYDIIHLHNFTVSFPKDSHFLKGLKVEKNIQTLKKIFDLSLATFLCLWKIRKLKIYRFSDFFLSFSICCGRALTRSIVVQVKS